MFQGFEVEKKARFYTMAQFGILYTVSLSTSAWIIHPMKLEKNLQVRWSPTVPLGKTIDKWWIVHLLPVSHSISSLVQINDSCADASFSYAVFSFLGFAGLWRNILFVIYRFLQWWISSKAPWTSAPTMMGLCATNGIHSLRSMLYIRGLSWKTSKHHQQITLKYKGGSKIHDSPDALGC